MPLADTEVARAIRQKERSSLKRNNYAISLRAIHGLAQRCVDDPDVISQLLVAVDTVDDLLNAFLIEDDSVLDSLIDLGLSSKYTNDLIVEMREIVIFSKAAANNCRARAHVSGQVSVCCEPQVHPIVETQPLLRPAISTPADLDRNGDLGHIVRLPEIPLPTFDGDIFQWPSFRDRFLSMVDNRQQLSNIDKIYYLIGCLKSVALDAVRGIPISGHTYKLVWSTLEARFDKPRLVACSVVETLLSAPMSSNESLSDLNLFMVAFDESVSVLNSLNIPNLGDFILFSLASRCLPISCRTLFESQVVGDYPTVDELLSFVKTRIAILERVQDSQGVKTSRPMQQSQGSQNTTKGYPRHSKSTPSSFVAAGPQSSTPVCKCCKGAHTIPSCPQFKGWLLDARVEWVREHKLCFRCLGEGHWSPTCRSLALCSTCSRKHHTLVHTDVLAPSAKNEDVERSLQSNEQPASSFVGHLTAHSVLLGTTLVHIRDCAGVLHTVRALVDSASQISAITSVCSNRLGLHMARWTAPVSGLSGATVLSVQGIVDCHIQPRFSPEPIVPFKAWVFPSITADMPRQQLSKDVADRYQHLALADPTFTCPSAIDLLLGADVFAQIFDGKRVTVGNSFPAAFSSVFGWIIIGPVPHSDIKSPHACPVSLTTSVESLLDRFWRIEEPEAAPEDFTDEGRCESIFRDGCARSASGRFTVPFPFRHHVTPDVFSGSRDVALKRFEHLERKLSADHRLRDLYCKFMAEYIDLGHMSLTSSPGKYFIPHHAVYRPSDVDPKIRVVFDASAKSFTGSSLNMCLLPGPKLQRDVIDVLLLFRLPRHAFIADICKMYRQILITSEHRCYQHILWRASPVDELRAYELNTVTYGVNCAPYLAIRVLKHIAEHDCSNHPLVREAILYHTYVDDICVGADSENEALELQSDLITVLQGAGLELKKWASNTSSVLNTVSPEDRACGPLPFEDSDGDGLKVLGLRWNHKGDYFGYHVQSDSVVYTKRGMLSLVARVFDPLGLLAPVVFLAKHFMQQVWKADLSWDVPLPVAIIESWRHLVSDLPTLQKLTIPRFVSTSRGQRAVLCGFCDASERGYAAVVYLRLEESSGYTSVSLLGTKTKLAPMGSTTIPRLELCAAVLLARWMARIKCTLSIQLDVTGVFAWSDSTIVLNWLLVRHELFKIFVSNRINQIHTLLPGCQWSHVASAENPADCASRGLLPSELVVHDLYWKGPVMLYSPIVNWITTTPYMPLNQLPEIKPMPPITLIVDEEPEWCSRFSSYVHMIRVMALVRRFSSRCRGKKFPEIYLTRSELDQAALAVIRSSQAYAFGQLRHELTNSTPVSVRPLARLRPFINDRGIICVGGRLSHSHLSDEQKFPILLSTSSHLALLLVRHWHDLTGHGGPRVMTALISRQYWIMSLRGLIRHVLCRCTICVRLAAVHPQPVMADLPKSRVSECRPFSRVGIDYAGPLLLKETKLRKSRQYKVYVAVFICFVVKAVHLEVVSDLTTDAFLAALQRFVARRGLPTDIYTDCGTNFVGAANQFRDLLKDPSHRGRLSTGMHCEWHFNPPAAPHFGGLWEAAVRSAKSLLVRIMGEHTFTLEEFGTILCRVEAILNSRPLTPSSTDPAEVDCLTPGHFLIGQPLLAVPEADIPTTTRTMINRWKLLNQCVQSFWHRWRDEYLHTLQSRNRWTSDAPNLSVGDMVVVKDPHAPPLKWNFARVCEIMPGADGVVRVVRLRIRDGFLVRPVVKLVKLPTA